MGLNHISSLKREVTLSDQDYVENNCTSGLNKVVKTKMNKTGTIDARRSVNVVKINSDASRKETIHERDETLIPMNKIHDMPETNMCPRKESYANIMKGS